MIYFTSRNIPQLQGLKYAERAEIIKLAQSNLSTPQKTVLNIIKLLFITPLFLLLANIESWWLLLYLFILGITYPVVTNPITFYFIRHTLDSAKDEYFKLIEK